jgi:hypothetical protein
MHCGGQLCQKDKHYSLLGCIPILCTLGINSQVNFQDVGAVEGLRHALNHYGLGHISRLCRSFQYDFIVHLKDEAVSVLSATNFRCICKNKITKLKKKKKPKNNWNTTQRCANASSQALLTWALQT